MKSLLVVLALAAMVSASSFSVTFTGNVSHIDKHAHWRKTGMSTLSLATAANLAYFYSFDAAAAASIFHNKTDASAEASSIFSLAGVTIGTVPMNWYAYFDAAVNAGISISDLSGIANLDAAAGFIGIVFPAIIERDTDGNAVATTSFVGTLLPALGGLSWTTDSTGTNTDGAHWFRILGTTTKSSLKVYFTFLVSDVVGVTDYSSTVVAPKNVETVVEIQDYPYKSTSNTIELKVVTASANATADGTAVVAKGVAEAHADLSAEAEYDGKKAAVHWSGWVAANITELDGSDLEKYIKQATNAASDEIKTFVSAIRFKAGATSIIYDPALGTGTSVYEYSNPSAASSFFPAALAMVAILLALF